MEKAQAEAFWQQLHNDAVNHHAGPRRNTKWSKVMDAARNKFVGGPSNPYDKAKTMVSVAAAIAGAGAPEHVPVVGHAITAIKTLIGIGTDLAKANAVDKNIGRVPEGAPKDEKADREAVVTQLVDSRAKDLLAEMTRLDTKLQSLNSVFYDCCVSWEDQLNAYAEARYLNNRLAQHQAYLEALAKKLQKVTEQTRTALNAVETKMNETTVRRFTTQAGQTPEHWHRHFCLEKGKKCLFPW